MRESHNFDGVQQALVRIIPRLTASLRGGFHRLDVHMLWTLSTYGLSCIAIILGWCLNLEPRSPVILYALTRKWSPFLLALWCVFKLESICIFPLRGKWLSMLILINELSSSRLIYILSHFKDCVTAISLGLIWLSFSFSLQTISRSQTYTSVRTFRNFMVIFSERLKHEV